MDLRKTILSIILLELSLIFAQAADTYQSAYSFINSMLTDEIPLSFKDAVFATENAYFDDSLDVEALDQDIEMLVQLTDVISDTELITYQGKDKNVVTKHAALFSLMTESHAIPFDSIHILLQEPYTYDFDDPFGQKDWSSMFVSKLLETGKGNCHSLPYLYKIVADELEIPCYLAFAPNHIYIKSYAESTGWYNTELTSGTFPIDAWIMASGYINVDAIQNGLYMDTLSTKQAVANCLVDLAHGYQQKIGRENSDFVIKCCNTALAYHPANVNAMLTKAESQKYYIDLQMKAQNVKRVEDLFADASIAEMYLDMEQTYVRLHQLGYRRIPEKMYMEWISSLKNEPNKYINKNIPTAPKK